MLNLDKESVEVPCPKCSHKFKETIGRLKQNPTLKCPRCGQETKVDATKMTSGLKPLEKSLGDLDKAFKNIGKR